MSHAIFSVRLVRSRGRFAHNLPRAKLAFPLTVSPMQPQRVLRSAEINQFEPQKKRNVAGKVRTPVAS